MAVRFKTKHARCGLDLTNSSQNCMRIIKISTAAKCPHCQIEPVASSEHRLQVKSATFSWLSEGANSHASRLQEMRKLWRPDQLATRLNTDPFKHSTNRPQSPPPPCKPAPSARHIIRHHRNRRNVFPKLHLHSSTVVWLTPSHHDTAVLPIPRQDSPNSPLQ